MSEEPIKIEKDFWPELYNDPYAVKRIERSLDLADIRPSHTVLDVGCHLGELEVYMPLEAMYYGIDILNGVNIDGGFSLPKKFDRILCLEVLEHLQHPIGTLTSIAEHLAPDGLAVISLPNEATLFHRLRSLFGVIDAEAFQECGKHLHLANLAQSETLLRRKFDILSRHSYISPQAVGSRQRWLGYLMRLLPDTLWQWLADRWSSLFARGFIWVCQQKTS